MSSAAPGISEIAAVRGCLYRLFSACLLRPPSDWVLEAFRDPEWRGALSRLLDYPAPDFPQDLPQERSAEALAAEHALLFLVPRSQTLPFESAHGNGPQPAALMGNAASRVVNIYRSWGLDPTAETNELPDHAATELSFMALLIAIEARVRQRKDEAGLEAVLGAQSQFLEQHILSWFPRWLNRVRESARRPFYRVLAELLERFLEKDRRSLGLPGYAGLQSRGAKMRSLAAHLKQKNPKNLTHCGGLPAHAQEVKRGHG